MKDRVSGHRLHNWWLQPHDLRSMNLIFYSQLCSMANALRRVFIAEVPTIGEWVCPFCIWYHTTKDVIYRAFLSRDHKFRLLEINHHLGIQLVQYVISNICNIDGKKTQVSIYIAVLTYVAMVFSTHIRVYHSFREDCHRSSYVAVHQHGGYFLFSFIISKVMTSHENTLLAKAPWQWLKALFIVSCTVVGNNLYLVLIEMSLKGVLY